MCLPLYKLDLPVVCAPTELSCGYLFALTLPQKRDIVILLLSAALLFAASDGLSWLLGKNIVTSFQDDIYRSAASAGAQVWLWLAVVIVAANRRGDTVSWVSFPRKLAKVVRWRLDYNQHGGSSFRAISPRAIRPTCHR